MRSRWRSTNPSRASWSACATSATGSAPPPRSPSANPDDRLGRPAGAGHRLIGVFNIGPLEFVVLAAVALIVFGPDKLPQLAKDAARMLRTLRDIAQGARSQLNSELGPEFAD